ncbi:MAG: phosphopentomutase [Clostridia bacterium]|nr:phosphopentomutase [Clostridia bacterium]
MRAVLIVIDSVGVGELPDADKYGDRGCDTFGHIWKSNGGIHIPNLLDLGLGNIDGILNGDLENPEPAGCFGKMSEVSRGKDTTTGHWEIAGLKTEVPFNTYPDGFPESFMKAYEERIGIGTLGNYPASGTEIIEVLGEEHEKIGKPIVYTSADSVFQVAMNVDLFGLDTLYRYCEIAREMLVDDVACCRVIARPYVIKDGKRERTSDRHDYSVTPPAETMLDKIRKGGKMVYAIGKIGDIFNGQGIDKSVHIVSNMDGVDKTIEAINEDTGSGIIFTNLVDFDAKYGHRRDPEGYGKCIEEFDERIPQIMNALKEDDILIITADHGNDPTAPGTDHTREYVPLLVYGKEINHGVNLGVRKTFSDISKTICDILEVEDTGLGESFRNEIM